MCVRSGMNSLFDSLVSWSNMTSSEHHNNNTSRFIYSNTCQNSSVLFVLTFNILKWDSKDMETSLHGNDNTPSIINYKDTRRQYNSQSLTFESLTVLSNIIQCVAAMRHFYDDLRVLAKLSRDVVHFLHKKSHLIIRLTSAVQNL